MSYATILRIRPTIIQKQHYSNNSSRLQAGSNHSEGVIPWTYDKADIISKRDAYDGHEYHGNSHDKSMHSSILLMTSKMLRKRLKRLMFGTESEEEEEEVVEVTFNE